MMSTQLLKDKLIVALGVDTFEKARGWLCRVSGPKTPGWEIKKRVMTSLKQIEREVIFWSLDAQL